jgi:hypothetical protein
MTCPRAFSSPFEIGAKFSGCFPLRKVRLIPSARARVRGQSCFPIFIILKERIHD